MFDDDYSFVVGDGPVAVLLIHGLTGTPSELRRVARGLADDGFTVYAPALAGHCGREADLLRTGWRDWYESVRSAFAAIRQRHREVFVGGLSMGAVLALHLAAEEPDAVAGLLLYSITMRYDGWNMSSLDKWGGVLLRLLPPLAKRYRFVEQPPYGIKDPRLRRVVERQLKAGQSGEAGLLAMPGRSLGQMLALIAVVKREVPRIGTKTLLLHAREDDMTSARNADRLERRLAGPVYKILLDDCYHMITIDRQYEAVVRFSTAFMHTARSKSRRVPLRRAAAE